MGNYSKNTVARIAAQRRADLEKQEIDEFLSRAARGQLGGTPEDIRESELGWLSVAIQRGVEAGDPHQARDIGMRMYLKLCAIDDGVLDPSWRPKHGKSSSPPNVDLLKAKLALAQSMHESLHGKNREAAASAVCSAVDNKIAERVKEMTENGCPNYTNNALAARGLVSLQLGTILPSKEVSAPGRQTMATGVDRVLEARRSIEAAYNELKKLSKQQPKLTPHQLFRKHPAIMAFHIEFTGWKIGGVKDSALYGLLIDECARAALTVFGSVDRVHGLRQAGRRAADRKREDAKRENVEIVEKDRVRTTG